MSFEKELSELAAKLDPEIYKSLKTAVEKKRWPDGRPLTQQQIETSMQAIIAYEHHNVRENLRVGHIDKNSTASCSKEEGVKPLKWN